MQIVDGHYIWEALKTLGWRDVWIVIVAGRSDAEIRALRLALNRIPEDAAWNDQALRREFEKLIEVGFDLAFTGFEPLRSIIGSKATSQNSIASRTTMFRPCWRTR